MWEKIRRAFRRSGKKLEIAKLMITYGLSVNEMEEILCGTLRIPHTSAAKACGTDRRTVKETVRTILGDPELREFYRNLEPAGSSLKRVSRLMGYRCLTIETTKDQPGIIAGVSSSLAKRNINIVQIVAEDPNLYPQPRLYIIVSGDVPGEALTEILQQPVIKSLTIS